jgi:hypothetical protein
VPHLREVFESYQKIYKRFEKVIESEFSGSVKTGLLALVGCISNCPAYFAKKLHESMEESSAGAGVVIKDKHLIRLIVTRSESDLGDIKIAFQKKYCRSLESFIEVQIYLIFKVLNLSIMQAPFSCVKKYCCLT